MKKRRLTLALTLILVALLPCALRTLLAQSAQIQEFMRGAENVRQIKFKKKVPTGNMSPSQFEKYQLKQLKREGVTKKRLKNLVRIGAKFGFYPRNFDMWKAQMEMLGGAAGGFYDHRTRRVFMLSGAGETGKQAQSQIVHELTHALDDQNFKIFDYFRKKAKDRLTDRVMATYAIAEGSAVTTQYHWMFGIPTYQNPQLRNLAGMYEQQGKANPAIAKCPEAMQLELLWRYSEGIRFVERLLKKGGPAELNKAFKDPPISTEQVLHPQEKYFNRDDPTEVDIDEKKLGKLLKGWKFLKKDNLGELFMWVFLKKYVGDAEAKRAAAGWDGDMTAGFIGKKKNQTLIIWLSVWDSKQDRDEFFNACKSALESKHSASATAQGDTCRFDGKEGPVLIEKKGMYVLVIDGTPKDKLEELKKEAWTNAKTK